MRKHLGMGKTVVLFGGLGNEQTISMLSGEFVTSELMKIGVNVTPILVKEFSLEVLRAVLDSHVINMLHGGWGENGKLQGMLDVFGVPYSGSRALPSALAMQKDLAKLVFMGSGIPTPDWHVLRRGDDVAHAVQACTKPVVVKPTSEGSSVGVELFEDGVQAAQLNTLLQQYQSLIIEDYVEGKILTVPIIDVLGEIRVLRPLEIVPTASKLYDRPAKKNSLRTYNFRPQLSATDLELVMSVALKAHNSLGCSGITRVDLVYSNSGQPFVLEVNTIPGMSAGGNLVSACKDQGISTADLMTYILDSVH